MLMSSYGTLELTDEEKTRNYKKTKYCEKFEYPESVCNHYQYRDSVDAHNSSRMFPIAIEETWKTTRCAYRVLCFLLAAMEVDCRLVLTNLHSQPECIIGKNF